MALNPSTNPTMAGRVTAADANYTYGSAKDESSAGAGDGSPYFKARADDIFGFQQWLLTQAALVPSGNADTVLVSQYGDALKAVAAPVGSSQLWNTAVVPLGWLEEDGAAVSRTTYAALFAVIGTTFGIGDGATTFNLPDMRGQFPRGWDHGAGVDPDAAGRTDRGDGTTGDNIGTKQSHSINTGQATEMARGGISVPTATGEMTYTETGNSGYASGSVGGRGTLKMGSGTETRPVNVNKMFIIRT